MPFIKEALTSLRNQTFTDWTLLISDNASKDGTEDVCKKFSQEDSRIKYVRQSKNIGVASNFEYLLNKVDSKFFMWASADDVWHSRFLETCIQLLEEHEDCSLAFSTIVNIDSYGRIIRTYPDFFRFTQKSHFKNICTYLLDPEIMGKANIIYSVYRLDLCKLAWKSSPLTDHWGSDMNFILAALIRGKLIVDKKVLFKKRIIRSTDQLSKIDKIVISNPILHTFPIQKRLDYLIDSLKAVQGTKYLGITIIILLIRVVMVMITSFIRFLNRNLNSNSF